MLEREQGTGMFVLSGKDFGKGVETKNVTDRERVIPFCCFWLRVVDLFLFIFDNQSLNLRVIMWILKVITLCAHYPLSTLFCFHDSDLLLPLASQRSYQLGVLQWQFVLENPLVIDEDHDEDLGETEETTNLREDSEDWGLWLAFPSSSIINDVETNLKSLELVRPSDSIVDRLLISLKMEGFLISIINAEKLKAVTDEITT